MVMTESRPTFDFIIVFEILYRQSTPPSPLTIPTSPQPHSLHKPLVNADESEGKEVPGKHLSEFSATVSHWSKETVEQAGRNATSKE